MKRGRDIPREQRESCYNLWRSFKDIVDEQERKLKEMKIIDRHGSFIEYLNVKDFIRGGRSWEKMN